MNHWHNFTSYRNYASNSSANYTNGGGHAQMIVGRTSDPGHDMRLSYRESSCFLSGDGNGYTPNSAFDPSTVGVGVGWKASSFLIQSTDSTTTGNFNQTLGLLALSSAGTAPIAGWLGGVDQQALVATGGDWLYGGGHTGMAESFTSSGGRLTSCTFFLGEVAASGPIVAKLYSVSGGLPDTLLATSDSVNANTIPTGPSAPFSFTFSGANQYVMAQGTDYFIAVEFSSGSGTGDGVFVGWDTGGGYSGGVGVFKDAGAWSSLGSNDLYFVVYADEILGTLSVSSAGTVVGDITGNFDRTLGVLALTSAGSDPVAGDFNRTLGTLALTSDGDVIVKGDFNRTLGTLTLNSAGVDLIAGSLDRTLGVLTLNSDGTVSTPSGDVIGDFNRTLGLLSLSSNGIATQPVPLIGGKPFHHRRDLGVGRGNMVSVAEPQTFQAKFEKQRKALSKAAQVRSDEDLLIILIANEIS